MASSSSLLLSSIAAAVVVLILITPAYSRKILVHHHHHKSTGTGFRVKLRHVDHGFNLSTSQRLQRAVLRSKHRVQKLSLLNQATLDTSPATVKSPIHPGKGEFLIDLSIGTPPLPFSAILDTGSDLIWTQCKPCVQCYHQPTPIFNPSNSSTFHHLPCNSHLCKTLPTTDCSSSSSACSYEYQYGDYSSTQGTLSSETFTFNSTVSVPGVAFGCGDDNEGSGFSQGAGLVGLGRGELSLVSQLDEPRFSYCLTSSVGSSKGAVLLMGSEAEVAAGSARRGVVTTPLVRNEAQPSFYYVSLEGISVGGSRLEIPKSAFAINDDGSGGMIVDSGTTITYLEESAFKVVKKEFVKRMKMAVSDEGSEKTGLDLCFEAGKRGDVEVPAMVLHFEGGDLELPPENYMVGEEEEGVVCLAMGGADGMSILGNVQQQNMVVLHDLRKETLSFAAMQCGDL